MITALHILGQIIFGGYFIYSGIKHFVNHRDYTAYASMSGVPFADAAVYGTGLLIILGGLGVLFNFYTFYALILLAVFLIPVTFIMHAFWKAPNPPERASAQLAFLKNMALLGAVFLMM